MCKKKDNVIIQQIAVIVTFSEFGSPITFPVMKSRVGGFFSPPSPFQLWEEDFGPGTSFCSTFKLNEIFVQPVWTFNARLCLRLLSGYAAQSVQTRIRLHNVATLCKGRRHAGYKLPLRCRISCDTMDVAMIYQRKLDSKIFNDVFNLAPWCVYRKLSLKILRYIYGGTYRDIDDSCETLLTRPTCKCIFSLRRGPNVLYQFSQASSLSLSLSRARASSLSAPPFLSLSCAHASHDHETRSSKREKSCVLWPH
jgi:hypothetical protein